MRERRADEVEKSRVGNDRFSCFFFPETVQFEPACFSFPEPVQFEPAWRATCFGWRATNLRSNLPARLSFPESHTIIHVTPPNSNLGIPSPQPSSYSFPSKSLNSSHARSAVSWELCGDPLVQA